MIFFFFVPVCPSPPSSLSACAFTLCRAGLWVLTMLGLYSSVSYIPSLERSFKVQYDMKAERQPLVWGGKSQRSTCLCLQGAGIGASHHLCLSFLFCMHPLKWACTVFPDQKEANLRYIVLSLLFPPVFCGIGKPGTMWAGSLNGSPLWAA